MSKAKEFLDKYENAHAANKMADMIAKKSKAGMSDEKKKNLAKKFLKNMKK